MQIGRDQEPLFLFFSLVHDLILKSLIGLLTYLYSYLDLGFCIIFLQGESTILKNPFCILGGKELHFVRTPVINPLLDPESTFLKKN